MKAAAAASALALVQTKLTPGESTDGAVFFPTEGKPLGRATWWCAPTPTFFRLQHGLTGQSARARAPQVTRPSSGDRLAWMLRPLSCFLLGAAILSAQSSPPDIVIVGAGIAGLTTALEAARPGRRSQWSISPPCSAGTLWFPKAGCAWSARPWRNPWVCTIRPTWLTRILSVGAGITMRLGSASM